MIPRSSHRLPFASLAVFTRGLEAQGVRYVAVHGDSGKVSFYPDPIEALRVLDPDSAES